MVPVVVLIIYVLTSCQTCMRCGEISDGNAAQKPGVDPVPAVSFSPFSSNFTDAVMLRDPASQLVFYIDVVSDGEVGQYLAAMLGRNYYRTDVPLAANLSGLTCSHNAETTTCSIIPTLDFKTISLYLIDVKVACTKQVMILGATVDFVMTIVFGMLLRRCRRQCISLRSGNNSKTVKEEPLSPCEDERCLDIVWVPQFLIVVCLSVIALPLVAVCGIVRKVRVEQKQREYDDECRVATRNRDCNQKVMAISVTTSNSGSESDNSLTPSLQNRPRTSMTSGVVAVCLQVTLTSVIYAREEQTTKLIQRDAGVSNHDVCKADQKETSCVAVVCGSRFRSQECQRSRVDLYVGDERLRNAAFRKLYGIKERDIIALRDVKVRSEATDENKSKVIVRLQLVGPEGQTWEHCIANDGETALPEVQRLYMEQLLRQKAATGVCHPQSAHWLLETSLVDPLPAFKAELEIQRKSDNRDETVNRFPVEFAGDDSSHLCPNAPV